MMGSFTIPTLRTRPSDDPYDQGLGMRSFGAALDPKTTLGWKAKSLWDFQNVLTIAGFFIERNVPRAFRLVPFCFSSA